MKDILVRFLFWSWVASLILCIVAIYVSSWLWTAVIIGYVMVTAAAAGFFGLSAKGKIFRTERPEK
jgi:hypothetical protein